MGEVATVVGGGTPKTSVPEYWNGDVPWVTPADLSGYERKYIARGARSITRSGLQHSGAQLMPAGAVLFSSRAPIGYVAIASQPLSTNQGFRSFVPGPDVLPDYVYHYLGGNKVLAVELAGGTTFLEVSGSNAKLIPIPVPPLAEQQGIVEAIEALLTRVEAGAAALSRVQANLKRYRASVIKAACEGRLVPTEAELARREGRDYEPASALLARILMERRRQWDEAELAKMWAKGGEPADDRWKKRYKEVDAPHIEGLPALPEGWCWAAFGQLLREPLRNGRSAKPVKTGGVRAITLTAVTYNDFGEYNTKLVGANPTDAADLWLQAGDILIERANTPELVGTSAVYRGRSGWAIYPDLVIRARLVSAIDDRFVERVLESEYVRAYFRRAAQGTAGSMPKISQEHIERMPVALPPFSEQRRLSDEIERRVSTTAVLLTSSDHLLDKATILRDSILRSAFAGLLGWATSVHEKASTSA